MIISKPVLNKIPGKLARRSFSFLVFLGSDNNSYRRDLMYRFESQSLIFEAEQLGSRDDNAVGAN